MNYDFNWLQSSHPDIYEQIQKVIDQPLDLTIRINQLKCESSQAIQKWANFYGWQFEPIPFCPSGYRVLKAETPPSSTIEHRLGYFYIQEAASMLPVELFDFEKLSSPLILDLAASPGGKTTHLADRSGDRGCIIANDASRSRIPALRIVLDTWGAINQAVTCLPGEAFGGACPEKFDAVLLDAPCSMQGLRASETHRARPITVNEVESLAARQVRLLESALRAVKVGGQVVYSTCTLTPQEDEGVLAEVLKRHPGGAVIEDMRSRLPKPAPGLETFNDEAFPKELQNSVRLWPYLFGTAGFFAARLAKTRPLSGQAESPRIRPQQPPQMKIPLASECRGIIQWISDLFGFDLAQVIQGQDLQIVEIHEELYLVPQALLDNFNELPWLSGGISLGKSLPHSWQPSHAFVSRFGDRFTKNVLILEDEHLPAWLRGEDIRGYERDEKKHWEVQAVRDRHGRNLGRGDLQAKRLKNMLPTRLF
jgi:16S rRNA (cytosine1407-C5)-methyltransferase